MQTAGESVRSGRGVFSLRAPSFSPVRRTVQVQFLGRPVNRDGRLMKILGRQRPKIGTTHVRTRGRGQADGHPKRAARLASVSFSVRQLFTRPLPRYLTARNSDTACTARKLGSIPYNTHTFRTPCLTHESYYRRKWKQRVMVTQSGQAIEYNVRCVAGKGRHEVKWARMTNVIRFLKCRYGKAKENTPF